MAKKAHKKIRKPSFLNKFFGINSFKKEKNESVYKGQDEMSLYSISNIVYEKENLKDIPNMSKVFTK